ncbi:MAG TPA: bifunctional acetate--CoA ligase family protein/GNAT family N-acetyltransferase [Ottowia sp.]|uniref:bifunctional acetate--CoA ligase family protein/GNAT family N-acetyltransferase n=1 Tax=Ottowia sp. TaxID=1898956 RepID=UPI002BCBBCE0|nr:bifunctional acetate--CoA ligase family protein/GNAT family N-acetyltransferase [Ottowia sp.]HMN20041.1 bifunctional acetate--CoA ligase family protein/GNAT family N-acetyltransferase [Ottowia sp.]
MDKHYLTALFEPASVILFTGDAAAPAQQTRLARALLAHLHAQPFQGEVTALDVNTSGTLADLAHASADLAIIALPEAEILPALELAGRIKVKAALVLAAGIGAAQARDMHRVAERHGFWMLGPNSQGLQRPALGLSASPAGALAAPGELALVSQSGALTASILEWARANQVGFSSVVAPGPHSQVDLAAVLDYLASDRQTHSIIVYMEGIASARRFTSALRAAAHAKPVVILKAGRNPASNVAAQTHSGAIVGSDDVFDAVLRRAGAVRVRSFVELFSAAKCLASRYRPTGNRLAIVTNGGGPGVLAADGVQSLGLELGTLSPEPRAALAAQVAPTASLADLIDLSEDATPAHYRAALEAVAGDRAIDGVLVIHSPKFEDDPQAVAQEVAAARPRLAKPLVACWMGGDRASDPILTAAQIPVFRTPEGAIRAFGNISSFYQNQLLLQQTPAPLTELAAPDLEGARLLIESVLAERRTVLTEMESKALLSAFHVPVTQTLLARSANEAMLIASQLGFPVALKIDSPDISHKSDVGGVALNLVSATAVRDAYQQMMDVVRAQRPDARLNGITVQAMARAEHGRELYVGIKTDEPFGPVIAFGAGGTLIELLSNHAMELPPLNRFLAERLIQRARVAETLGDWRGHPAIDAPALERLLLRVSEMACELPQLREMDINPLIASPDGVIAVDARIVIADGAHAGAVRGREYGHLSIPPYPARLAQVWPLRGGGEYRLRPIRPHDAQMLQELVSRLSDESRYFRFAANVAVLPPSMLSRFTLIDYDREMALCAEIDVEEETPEGERVTRPRIIGVSRYITNPDQTSCEFSLVVDDAHAGQGLGTRLMRAIMDVARERGLKTIEGLVLAGNTPMLKLMRSLDFSIRAFPEDPDFKLVVHGL